MHKLNIAVVAGARPNFMKIAPLFWEFRRYNRIQASLIHTGQHYDAALNDIFFKQLDIPPPSCHLGVGSGSHGWQTAQIIIGLEAEFIQNRPDIVIVVGDVNSTLASALTASKLQIPLAHIESGLRSHDRTMPEEINRIVTDSLSQYLFVTEESGILNLRKEGVDAFLKTGKPIETVDKLIQEEVKELNKGYAATRFGAFVGNIMIDTLLAFKDMAPKEAAVKVPNIPYGLLTLHRPRNVDDPSMLTPIVKVISEIAKEIPILFPCHPRTKKRIQEFGLERHFISSSDGSEQYPKGKRIHLLEPVGYFDFLSLIMGAKLVLTDSGGIQEETTILGVPCLTLRDTTERPVTLTEGTNSLVGTDPDAILKSAYQTIHGVTSPRQHPILWDGAAAGRIVKILSTISE